MHLIEAKVDCLVQVGQRFLRAAEIDQRRAAIHIGLADTGYADNRQIDVAERAAPIVHPQTHDAAVDVGRRAIAHGHFHIRKRPRANVERLERIAIFRRRVAL